MLLIKLSKFIGVTSRSIDSLIGIPELILTKRLVARNYLIGLAEIAIIIFKSALLMPIIAPAFPIWCTIFIMIGYNYLFANGFVIMVSVSFNMR